MVVQKKDPRVRVFFCCAVVVAAYQHRPRAEASPDAGPPAPTQEPSHRMAILEDDGIVGAGGPASGLASALGRVRYADTQYNYINTP